jgi:hypothetical protein
MLRVLLIYCVFDPTHTRLEFHLVSQFAPQTAHTKCKGGHPQRWTILAQNVYFAGW